MSTAIDVVPNKVAAKGGASGLKRVFFLHSSSSDASVKQNTCKQVATEE